MYSTVNNLIVFLLFILYEYTVFLHCSYINDFLFKPEMSYFISLFHATYSILSSSVIDVYLMFSGLKRCLFIRGSFLKTEVRSVISAIRFINLT